MRLLLMTLRSFAMQSQARSLFHASHCSGMNWFATIQRAMNGGTMTLEGWHEDSIAVEKS